MSLALSLSMQSSALVTDPGCVPAYTCLFLLQTDMIHYSTLCTRLSREHVYSLTITHHQMYSLSETEETVFPETNTTPIYPILPCSCRQEPGERDEIVPFAWKPLIDLGYDMAQQGSSLEMLCSRGTSDLGTWFVTLQKCPSVTAHQIAHSANHQMVLTAVFCWDYNFCGDSQGWCLSVGGVTPSITHIYMGKHRKAPCKGAERCEWKK